MFAFQPLKFDFNTLTFTTQADVPVLLLNRNQPFPSDVASLMPVLAQSPAMTEIILALNDLILEAQEKDQRKVSITFSIDSPMAQRIQIIAEKTQEYWQEIASDVVPTEPAPAAIFEAFTEPSVVEIEPIL